MVIIFGFTLTTIVFINILWGLWCECHHDNFIIGGRRMNYKWYRFIKLCEKMTDKFFDFVFFLPRYLYKNNKKFKQWIKNNDQKHHKKKTIKRLSKRIFFDLERQGECIVYCGVDWDNVFDFDEMDTDYEWILENDKWIKKNQIYIEKMTLEQYVEKYEPKSKHNVHFHIKNKNVYIIKKL
jgi:hypothetical protein